MSVAQSRGGGASRFTSVREVPASRVALARVALGIVTLVPLALAAACGPPCELDADCPEGSGCRDGYCASECLRDEDCPLGTDCAPNGLCGPPAAGEIVWLAPAPGAAVGDTFDAELEVSFRAPNATLQVRRSTSDPGDGCSPFVPVEHVLLGDQEEHLTHRVTLPGLRALGERFSLSATLQSAAGGVVEDIALRGPASDLGGVRFTQPDTERTFEALGSLTVPVGALLEQTSARVSAFVEPVGGVAGPITLIGAGLSSFEGAPVLLARGPQIIWIDADGARCGRGAIGVGGYDEDLAGLEVGLHFSSSSPSQLGLRLLVESGGSSTACGFVDPGTTCEAVRETIAPALVGEQVMRVPLLDGVAQIAVVPGAAGGFATAVIRVSFDGRHLGWLGPYPIETGAGEAWIAGQVVIGSGTARLTRTDGVTIGAPW